MNRILGLGLAFAAAVGLVAGCTKTREWEEEVLLNTGEIIWVKRVAKYSYQGGLGNPLDMDFRLEGSPTLEFTYDKRKYSFREQGGLMVLAISPQKTPVLVMSASSGLWHVQHNYKCTYPFYVQFEPDASGQNWSWPPAIGTWLYGLPTNLFGDYGAPDGMITRYSIEQKGKQQYLRDPQLEFAHKILPTHTGDACEHMKR